MVCRYHDYCGAGGHEDAGMQNRKAFVHLHGFRCRHHQQNSFLSLVVELLMIPGFGRPVELRQVTRRRNAPVMRSEFPING